MMRRPSHRPERVAEVIRQTVAEFLTGNVRDPRVGFVTVTGVEVSGDLGHARVRVSVMGTEEEKAKAFAEHPVGSGPFVLERWERGTEMVLKRNSNYWQMGEDGKALPYLNEIK